MNFSSFSLTNYLPLPGALALLIGNLATHALAERPPIVEDIIDEYGEIEAKLPRAREIHRQIAEEEWVTNLTGWYDESQRLIKLREYSFDDYGGYDRESSFREDGSLVFFWERTETTPLEPNAKTTIAEMRLYFSRNGLERVLRKEDQYAIGEVQDLHRQASNVLSPEDGQTKVGGIPALLEKLTDFREQLEALHSPPFTRFIEGTTSPDGRLALAWAPDSGDREEVTPDGEAANPDAVHNFLVVVEPRQIIALSDGTHFADAAEIGRLSATAVWSANSEWVLEINENKWGVILASLWNLQDGVYATNPVNVLREIEPKIAAQLKQGNHPAAERLANGEPFVPSFDDIRIDNEGVVTFGISASIPHDPLDDASGAYAGTVRLTPGFEDSGFMIANRVDFEPREE